MNGKYRAMQSVARVKPNISRLNFLAGWTAAASTVSRAPQLRGSRACKGPKTMGKDFFFKCIEMSTVITVLRYRE